MTLVVGRVIEGSCRILADAQITIRDEERFRTPCTGALKAIALGPATAVAYSSNDADEAVSAVRQEATRLGFPRTPVDARALATALVRYTEDDVHEFFTASRAAFHVARAGRVTLDQASAWLGEQPAFNEYQSFYHDEGAAQAELIMTANWECCDPADVAALAASTRNSSEAREEYWSRLRDGGWPSGYRDQCRMHDAFRAVVEGGKFPSVGNFVVTLSAGTAADDGFRYLAASAGFGFHPVAATTTPCSVLESRGVAGGSYHESVLVPTTAGLPALGIYILEAKMGILFLPMQHDQPIVMKGVTAGEFIARAHEQNGIDLGGFPWTSEPP